MKKAAIYCGLDSIRLVILEFPADGGRLTIYLDQSIPTSVWVQTTDGHKEYLYGDAAGNSRDAFLLYTSIISELDLFGNDFVWELADGMFSHLYSLYGNETQGLELYVSRPAAWPSHIADRLRRSLELAGFTNILLATEEQSFIAGCFHNKLPALLGRDCGTKHLLFIDNAPNQTLVCTAEYCSSGGNHRLVLTGEPQWTHKVTEATALEDKVNFFTFAVWQALDFAQHPIDMVIVRRHALGEELITKILNGTYDIEDTRIALRKQEKMPSIEFIQRDVNNLILGMMLNFSSYIDIPAPDLIAYDPNKVLILREYRVINALLKQYYNLPDAPYKIDSSYSMDCIMAQAEMIHKLLCEQEICQIEIPCILENRMQLLKANVSRGGYNATLEPHPPIYADSEKVFNVSIRSYDHYKPAEAIAFIKEKQPEWILTPSQRDWLREKLSSLGKNNILKYSAYVHIGDKAMPNTSGSPLFRMNTRFNLPDDVEVYGCISSETSAKRIFDKGTLITEYGIICTDDGLFRQRTVLYGWQFLSSETLNDLSDLSSKSGSHSLTTHARYVSDLLPEYGWDLREIIRNFIDFLKSDSLAAKNTPTVPSSISYTTPSPPIFMP